MNGASGRCRVGVLLCAWYKGMFVGALHERTNFLKPLLQGYRHPDHVESVDLWSGGVKNDVGGTDSTTCGKNRLVCQ
jgi:hypothetical protein